MKACGCFIVAGDVKCP